MREKMYTVKEVSEQLKVSERTVRHWVETGQLVRFKIGKREYRIPESALDEFIKRQTGKQE